MIETETPLSETRKVYREVTLDNSLITSLTHFITSQVRSKLSLSRSEALIKTKMIIRTQSRFRGLRVITQGRPQFRAKVSKRPPTSSNTIKYERLPKTSHSVRISTNGKDYLLNALFLRDSCSCTRCVDPSTSQKLFDTASIPFTVHARQPEVQSDGSVSIKWDNDIPGYEEHTSVYPQIFFSNNLNFRSRLTATQNNFPRVLWDRTRIEKNSDPVQYASYMTSSSILHKALSHLQHYGLLFLSSVPSDPGSVEMIAGRIGTLQNTFYGSTWDVRSVPSAKNVAYTSSNLGFHMVSLRSIFLSSSLNSALKSTIGTGSALLRNSTEASDTTLHESKHDWW